MKGNLILRWLVFEATWWLFDFAPWLSQLYLSHKVRVSKCFCLKCFCSSNAEVVKSSVQQLGL